MNAFFGIGRFDRFKTGLAPVLAVLLTWSVLAIGFHQHVERGPSHDCQVCTATHVQAPGIQTGIAPATPLTPIAIVVARSVETPRVIAHIFVPNRAPPLS